MKRGRFGALPMCASCQECCGVRTVFGTICTLQEALQLNMFTFQCSPEDVTLSILTDISACFVFLCMCCITVCRVVLTVEIRCR